MIVNVDEDIGTITAVPFDTNAVTTGKRNFKLSDDNGSGEKSQQDNEEQEDKE